MAFLPASILLFEGEPRSYLRYVRETGLVRFDYTASLATDHPFIRMEVELAGHTDNLVHLKCVFSNRYWRRESSSNFWLAAEQREPEVSQNSWNCTLFKPERVGSAGIRFQHMETGRYVGMRSSGSTHINCLYVGLESTQTTEFRYLDWSQIVLLPQYVAFEKAAGEQKGKYLCERANQLEFESDDFIELKSSHVVTTTRNAEIRIKCNGFPLGDSYKFWTTSAINKVIHGFSGSEFRPFVVQRDPETFEPKYIAIGYMDPSLNANRFCRRRSNDSTPNQFYLAADAPTMSNETRMEVREQVHFRELYNYIFRETNGRIYDERVVDIITQEFTNVTDLCYNATLEYEYIETITRKWEHNVHVSGGITTSVQTSIPFVFNASIEYRIEAGYSYTWGQEVSRSSRKTTSVSYTVPSRTKLIMTLIVSEAKLDLPFSYTQKDHLYTGGPPVIYVKHDGVFKGVNTCKFNYDPRIEPL